MPLRSPLWNLNTPLMTPWYLLMLSAMLLDAFFIPLWCFLDAILMHLWYFLDVTLMLVGYFFDAYLIPYAIFLDNPLMLTWCSLDALLTPSWYPFDSHLTFHWCSLDALLMLSWCLLDAFFMPLWCPLDAPLMTPWIDEMSLPPMHLRWNVATYEKIIWWHCTGWTTNVCFFPAGAATSKKFLVFCFVPCWKHRWQTYPQSAFI